MPVLARCVLVGVFLFGACKKDSATQPAAPNTGGKEKGARTDKPTAQAGAPIALAAIVDGKPAVTWTRNELGRVKSIRVAGDQGDEQRAAWSLRDIVATLVGAKASVTELTGEGGGKMRLDPAMWKDATKQPVLRQNRRGILKFYWVDAEGLPLEGDGLRGVRELKISVSK